MNKQTLAAVLALLVAGLAPARVQAHCDSLDGPVVTDARAALDSGRVDAALKWVTPDREAGIREAFQRTLAVRALGAEARALADRFFLETLVRVHRDGEGAPFTGLKPAGHVDPAIAAADRALETGAIDAFVHGIAAQAETGLRERFRRAAAARLRTNENVARGREAVAAYVEFVHYAERLQAALGHGAAPHHVHETEPHHP